MPTYPNSPLRRLLESFTLLVVSILALISLMIVVALLLVNNSDTTRDVSIAALGSCIIWTLAYRIVSVRTLKVVPDTTNKEDKSKTNRSSQDTILVYGIAGIAFGLGVISVFGVVGQIATQRAVVDQVLVYVPLIGFFPISYLAYAAFQRNVRLERLQLDFELLGVDWNKDLAAQSQHLWNFALHIVLAMAVTLIGLQIFFLPTYPQKVMLFNQFELQQPVLQALRYGFFGSYLFSIQLIYRRYTTYDLQPTVYMYSALTIIGGVVFNYIAFNALSNLAANEAQTGLGSGLFAILAFALGFFPIVTIQWIDQVVHNALKLTQSRSEALPLKLIDGISQFHEIRLRDHGVDNIQNLASVDIPLLLLNTTFNVQEIIDWVDQAILYLYLEPSEIDSFRRSRIRTISDFHYVWKPYYRQAKDAQGNPELGKERESRALQLSQSTAEKLDILYQVTEQGPNLHYVVHYWKNADFTRRIRYFYEVSQKYSPQFSNAMALSFLQNRYNDPDPVITDDEIKNLESMWDEIEHYPIKDDQKVHPDYSLVWAGLAALKQWQLNHPDQSLDNRAKNDEGKKVLKEEALKYANKALEAHNRSQDRICNLIKSLEAPTDSESARFHILPIRAKH